LRNSNSQCQGWCSKCVISKHSVMQWESSDRGNR
jgi:hypothetical protein